MKIVLIVLLFPFQLSGHTCTVEGQAKRDCVERHQEVSDRYFRRAEENQHMTHYYTELSLRASRNAVRCYHLDDEMQ